MANTKKYLITHSEANTSASPVGQILGASAANIKNGINMMALEAAPAATDILEFPNLGITAAHLSDAQVKQLRESEGILAVEEDREMHILEVADYQQDPATASLAGNGSMDNYQQGYNEGLQHMLESLGQSQSSVNPSQQMSFGTAGIAQGNFSDALGTLPTFPRLPIPFPIRLRQPTPWNITMVKAPGAWSRGITGKGIRLAIIDTGISNHTDLLPVSGGVSFVPGVVSFNDDNGHGTHCAGIAAARNNFSGVVGVAPEANLYAVKVLAASGSGSTSGVIAGMDWAATHGMHVVSMSLGGSGGPSVAYANAVKRLQDRGTVVVIASGNAFGTAFPWVAAPANSIIAGVPNASPIAVGAIDQNRIIASFSSRGGSAPLWNQVTVVAPGVSINSTVPLNAYGVKSGTSMATPHVAGAAVLLKQRFPGISAAAVKARLRNTATDLGPAGVDVAYGSGLINCDLATQ